MAIQHGVPSQFRGDQPEIGGTLQALVLHLTGRRGKKHVPVPHRVKGLDRTRHGRVNLLSDLVQIALRPFLVGHHERQRGVPALLIGR